MDSIDTQPGCLHNIFEKHVDLSPTEPAIFCGPLTLTYAEVEIRANKLARHLQKYGAKPGTFVGLYFDRSEKAIISILAVLKAGAAYVPLDPNYPLDRIEYILTNTNVSIIISEKDYATHAATFFTKKIIALDTDAQAIEAESAARLTKEETGVSPNDLCYIIYTSGTTGRPKGVMTQHKNVVAFVYSFNEFCCVKPKERVYQGFSLGFDGSVEEIWMAYSNGASLVVGTPDVARYGNEVAKLLTEMNVVYFSTVPTFLSMISEELPTVQFLVVSGEACPAELCDMWAKPGRRMLNVYGPTECTVNSTTAELHAGKKVTIGKPLRGYDIYILDENQNPVPHGETGELYIGGCGVSRGYMNSPEITAKSFLDNPVKGKTDAGMVYRTGDLVRYNAEDEILFLGRIDTQVKIRGYRIELSEIESVLLEHPMIQSAAVKVHEREGLKELAAFVVGRDNSKTIEIDSIVALLQKRLPVYMIPSYLDILESLPTLTSGKINRKMLPDPKTILKRSNKAQVLPETAMEKKLVPIWEKIVKISPVSTEDDFFLDLGGYSLLAAQMISLIRNELDSEITLRDIYQYPTIKKLGAHVTATLASATKKAMESTPPKKKQTSRTVFESIPKFVRWSCYTLQALSLYGMYALATIPMAAILILYFAFDKGQVSLQLLLGIIVAAGFLAFPTLLTISLLAKWLIIGKYKPGEYKVWGWYYFKWWIVTRLQTLSGAAFLVGTPLMSRYMRLMGAKVGHNCTIASSQCYIFDLLTIGNNTTISSESQILGYRVEDGLLKIGSTKLGDNCFVGISSAVGLNTIMENNSALDDLSLLPDNKTIRANEAHRGSPCKLAKVSLPQSSNSKPTPRHPFIFSFVHLLGLYGIEVFMLLASIPTIMVAYFAYKVDSILLWIGLILAAIPLYEITFCLLLVFVKKLVLGRAKAGTYPIHSIYYVRNWFVDSLLALSRMIVLPVYTTLYYLPWVRMLGAKVGARAEFSVISQMIPDLTTVGEESFLADGSIIGGMRMYNGLFQLAETSIGKRTFLGNSAVLPVGGALGDNCLLGVLSAPPNGCEKTPDSTEWLGSPSFNLPHRKKVEGFTDETIFKPSKRLFTHRLLIDALRICIPSVIEIFGVISLFGLLYISYSSVPLWLFALISPLITGFIGILLALSVVGVKNLLMGQFTPIIKPLWSPYVWLNEAVNGAYEAIAAPIISMYFGTPFVSLYLRLLGCKIGKHAFIETALFGEFDLVKIGDYVALNNNTIIQNHLFEDRIFKASNLVIGDECSTGNMSVVLYDSEMQHGSSIGPLSLLMKSETLPPESNWIGIPVEKN